MPRSKSCPLTTFLSGEGVFAIKTSHGHRIRRPARHRLHHSAVSSAMRLSISGTVLSWRSSSSFSLVAVST